MIKVKPLYAQKNIVELDGKRIAVLTCFSGNTLYGQFDHSKPVWRVNVREAKKNEDTIYYGLRDFISAGGFDYVHARHKNQPIEPKINTLINSKAPLVRLIVKEEYALVLKGGKYIPLSHPA
ncbi:MAG: hypothetical protein V1866_02335 [archaeon]